MARPCLPLVFLALAALGQANARDSQPSQQNLKPELKDVSSDKKFFGPPFPADYPDDKRPVAQKSILDKLKGPSQPYPALQSKDEYDRDFVKDENSDKGAWQAQFEYDALRKKLLEKEADEKRAAERAAREGRDEDDARREDEDAATKVRNAMKDAEDAARGESDSKGEDDVGPPPTNDLDEMKRRVADCETKYEQALKNFKECERQLEEAKTNLETLKAQLKALEEKHAADTKLWAEQKTVKLNLKTSKKEAAEAKRKTAEQKLAAAEKTKADLEKVLAKEKAESEKAQEELKKQQAKMQKFKKDIDNAALKLQAIHGYKPAKAEVAPTKSGAQSQSVSHAFLIMTSAFVIIRVL